MKPREKCAVTEHLVDERIRRFFARQMDRQTKRTRMALDLPFNRAGVRRFHEARPAAGDDVDAHPGEFQTELLHFLVDRIAATDSRAAENRHTVVLDALRLDLIE